MRPRQRDASCKMRAESFAERRGLLQPRKNKVQERGGGPILAIQYTKVGSVLSGNYGLVSQLIFCCEMGVRLNREHIEKRD